jgi:hypothetical protein
MEEVEMEEVEMEEVEMEEVDGMQEGSMVLLRRNGRRSLRSPHHFLPRCLETWGLAVESLAVRRHADLAV